MTTTATTSSPALISRRRSPILTSLLFNNNNNKSVYISSLRPQNIPTPSSSVASHVTRVTTVPIEYAPPAPEFHLSLEIKRLMNLKSALFGNPSLDFDDKITIIDCDPKVKMFFRTHAGLVSRIFASLSLSKYDLYLVKCVVAAGQGHVISSGVFEVVRKSELASARGSLKSALYALVDIIEKWDGNVMSNGSLGTKMEALPLEREQVKALLDLLKTLANVEKFYNCIGGIIGYQIMVLNLLSQSTFDKLSEHWSQQLNETEECKVMDIHSPTGLDLSKNKEYAVEAALWGVEGLHNLGEIYPLGGSADRLGLVDADTGECLPAAMLPYCGRTLLEGLIRDLQAREFLYYKLYGKQCITPVAIMTSSAKKNHERITALCEKLEWFGRGRSNFRLFEQPLVPAVTAEDGQWIVTKPFAPLCKPGGHGVIWKLAYDNGVFKWFYNHGRKGVTVRQVSNVVAATDVTLLALAGIGMRHGKKLGFASCRRNLGASKMMTGDDETHRLYRIMRTVMQMLKDRGYYIRDDEIDMSKEQFVNKYGENPKRDDLVMVKSKLTNSDRIFVFFPEEAKVGVKTMKAYTNKMKSEDVYRALLVVQQNLTPFARTCLSEVASKFHLEVFLEAELLINIKEHVLVPEHQVLADTDKKNLLVRYTVKETQLPRIQVTDPVARYYGLKRGQVVRIIRPSETAGRYITYRYCV